MDNEFTIDEIREAITIARIYSPGLTEEQFQGAIELEKRLEKSGYPEAVHSLSRLEKEEGVLCTEALDRCKQLLHDTVQKEAELASLREKLVVQQDKNRQAEDRYRQVKEAIEQAKDELRMTQTERQKEEKELIAFKKRAEREKQRIDEELEGYQRKANVTKEEITGTSKLKDQLASRGFTIEFTLDLCQEFMGHENAREELAKAIEEYGTLTKANAALIEQGRAQKKALESEQAKVKSLEGTRHQLESIISQLQTDVAYEEELRRFYHRYQGAGVLMEYLAGWKGIFFVRCNNPLYALTGAFDRSTSGARFWTEKPPMKRCPCCNYPDAVYDEELYRALNQPAGTPLQLKLGE